MVEISNKTRQKINKQEIARLAGYFLKVVRKQAVDVSIAIVGEKQMRILNRQYRGYDRTTDVLSFSGAEWEGNLLGEIVINPQELKRVNLYWDILSDYGLDKEDLGKYEASRRKAERYLFYFILVHGLYHLLGYNDETEPERQEMLRLGRKFLKKAQNDAIIKL